ncbi:hypothetical protein P153DRAFT_380561 [Dothidotthia symphoricarpi CBS 119687]|uniref:Uncharacterized protein n=1 Tax=Dothidotthia symphoricarpi CBS 119687 TaxID=1392245 RepID=A0A6A6ASW7_9PLEO|nr:uncharacterized protein P153DRAFT_380561 [Dothidotthia symphoricarpi CBS 119687]KAF2134750.1 hypothetical protein P153DRAFT_380561 [Dothidotthia symphoricarpi CBS 119687]
MCEKCAKIPAADAEQAVQNVRKAFRRRKELINAIYNLCDRAEDQYRSIGISYHSTQQGARHPDHFPAERLNRLKQAFEISSIEEYDAVFAHWKKIVDDLTHISRTHFRRSGTAEELWHRLNIELEPAFDKTYQDYIRAQDGLQDLNKDVNELLNVSIRFNYTDNMGLRYMWCDPTGTDHTPRRQGQEWATYCAWISSLPETQRSVGSRTVDEIALELLYASPDEIIDE